VAKRKYTHKKGRLVPVEHGSIIDELDHDMGGSPLSGYKTKKKRKSIF